MTKEEFKRILAEEGFEGDRLQDHIWSQRTLPAEEMTEDLTGPVAVEPCGSSCPRRL
jgi:hypothetical protein